MLPIAASAAIGIVVDSLLERGNVCGSPLRGGIWCLLSLATVTLILRRRERIAGWAGGPRLAAALSMLALVCMSKPFGKRMSYRLSAPSNSPPCWKG